MAEIKTIEHYIITRIQDLEAQVAEQEAEIRNLQLQSEVLRKALADMAPHFRIITNCRGDGKYIHFDGPWNDNPLFDKLVKLFGLKEEED